MPVPRLVDCAQRWAEAQGFTRSCRDDVGGLLSVLAGTISSGRIADIGTGCGVSTAWMASATGLDIFTIDNDATRAEGLYELFGGYDQVHVMVGDWTDILQWGPFRLVFVDAKPAKIAGVEALVHATEIGGLLVLDDFTPREFWPDQWQGRPDRVREAWLHHPRLVSTEIRPSPKISAIVACRRA